MPNWNSLVKLPGMVVRKVSGYNPVCIEVKRRDVMRCVDCGSKRLRKKHRYKRIIQHESIGHRRVELHLWCYKRCCYDCGRYFNERIPGVQRYERVTGPLKRHIFQLHSEGVSQKDLAHDFKRSSSTIERWYHAYYQRFGQEQSDRLCPRVLGIDEHSFSRKQSCYATTLCDLEKHRVFDVVKGRSKASLQDYLLSLKGRERVRVVCMDLSGSYKSIVQQYFPQARIVADRFHVIRLLQEMFLKTCHQLDPDVKYQRGILRLLRTKTCNLTPGALLKRQAYFNAHPAIAAVFVFKEKLYNLLLKKHRTQHQCKKLIPLFLSYVQQLKQSGFVQLAKLGKTLYRWREAIVCMWRFTKSNGITEGFHRKMKLIQRRAYGFRNFENYRLRVKVLCS